jgi:hypothetical protein
LVHILQIEKEFAMTAKIQLRLALFVLLLSLLTFAFQPARAQTEVDPSQVVADAFAYLKSQQQPDGGILGFAGASDPDTTIRTVLALVANNRPLVDFTSSEGNTLLAYLASQADAYLHDPNGLLFPGRAGLLLSAVALSGEDVHDFAGLDLAGELAASFQPDTGAYATAASLEFSSGAASDLNQGWAVLGLSLAGQPIPTSATFYFAGTQAEDGSWAGGDPDTTALVVNALLASRNLPQDDPMLANALAFFKSTQLPNGGWKPSWDEDPLNADTTGWVVAALVSAGQVPLEETWAAAEGDPLSALYSLVKADGSIGGTFVNAYSTADALIGLGQAPFPSLSVSPVYQRAALVVQNGDASLLTACVAFTEESLSGFELLNRSGLEVASVTDPSLGTAICGIGAGGCPSTNCFCGMPDYWSYWQPGEGDWAYAVIGSEQFLVKDGSIEAWSWGEGTPPAYLTFEQVCQPGSLQPASVAVQSESVAATAYPEPAAATATTALESYPLPAATTSLGSYPAPASTQPPAEPTAYPDPSAGTQPSGSSAVRDTITSAAPYLILFVIVAALFLGILVLSRRNK